MRVIVYTFCYNEIDILPFAADYWRRFAARVVVYDNQSIDGSREFLKNLDFVELRTYSTDNQLNDIVLKDMKNEVWKESRGKADFVNVCDLDECLFIPDLQFLSKAKADGIAVVTPKTFNLIDPKFPKYDGQLMHLKTPRYYIETWDNKDNPELQGQIKQKAMLFDPLLVKESNYKIGCYRSNFQHSGKSITTDEVKCLHLHDVGLVRKIRRYKERAMRMSRENIKLHLSDFYLESSQKITSDFIETLVESRKIDF